MLLEQLVHRERLVELGVAAAGERERAGQQLEGELGLVRVLGFVEGASSPEAITAISS